MLLLNFFRKKDYGSFIKFLKQLKTKVSYHRINKGMFICLTSLQVKCIITTRLQAELFET